MNTDFETEIGKNKVAIYVRKSRGDGEEVLEKHKSELVNLCKEKGWEYDVYSEIGSADSLTSRPEMLKLLEAVKQNHYQAVVVYDYDRLGRGDLGDQDKLHKTFKFSNTKVVTVNPYNIYDLSIEQDEQYTDFHSFVARQEYKMIKKRLQQGKYVGAKMGNWTNGTPPFPYFYDKNTKNLIVDNENYYIYREMINMFFKGYPLTSIAKHLTNKGILTPKGKNEWESTTIKRLLKDEVHLGKIIYNKTKHHQHNALNSKTIVEKNKKEEWIVAEGSHTPVKSENEHNAILRKMKERKPRPRGTYLFSGLIKCGVCNRAMTFSQSNDKIKLKACYNTIDSKRCVNRGGKISILTQEVMMQMNKYINHLESMLLERNLNKEIEEINMNISEMKKRKTTEKNQLSRIQEAYEIGAYEVEEYLKRQNTKVIRINELNEEIKAYHHKKANLAKWSFREEIRKIKNTAELLQRNELTSKQQNEFLKTIIDHISWKRETDDILEIQIRFNSPVQEGLY
ncbi:recombinase family protein [Salibacterium sp. K-3]